MFYGQFNDSRRCWDWPTKAGVSGPPDGSNEARPSAHFSQKIDDSHWGPPLPPPTPPAKSSKKSSQLNPALCVHTLALCRGLTLCAWHTHRTADCVNSSSGSAPPDTTHSHSHTNGRSVLLKCPSVRDRRFIFICTRAWRSRSVSLCQFVFA